MIIVLKQGATQSDAEPILEQIRSLGLKPLYLPGDEKIVLGALGDERSLAALNLDAIPVVEKVLPILKPYKLANKEFKPERSTVRVGSVVFGGRDAVPVSYTHLVFATRTCCSLVRFRGVIVVLVFLGLPHAYKMQQQLRPATKEQQPDPHINAPYTLKTDIKTVSIPRSYGT